MIWSTIAFWVFASFAVMFGLGVISARNPVHSVLFLIATFFQAAGLFVLLGAEFLAMILMVVYVGAVAVLFLFVVMMLDVDFAALKRGALQYLPIGGIVGLIFMAELLMVVGTIGLEPDIGQVRVSPVPVVVEATDEGTDEATDEETVDGSAVTIAASGQADDAASEDDDASTQVVRQVSNIEALGRILYTDYIYLFQAAGMILLLAMIGAIVLTLRHKPHVKRQSISAQVNRRVEDSMEVVKVKPGQGI